MKFTQIPADTFKKLQLNAGILAKSFDPSTGTVRATDIIGATTGGVSFTATPSYTDFGEDIDNCPANMKELKVLDTWEITLSGTMVTVDRDRIKSMIGPADLSDSDTTLVTPRNDLLQEDFEEIWWVGDYSDVNEDGDTGQKAGFLAIQMSNALSTGGFQLQSSDAGKGNFSFEYTAHFSMDAQSVVPFKVYVKGSTDIKNPPVLTFSAGSGAISSVEGGKNFSDLGSLIVAQAGTSVTLAGELSLVSDWTDYSETSADRTGYYVGLKLGTDGTGYIATNEPSGARKVAYAGTELVQAVSKNATSLDVTAYATEQEANDMVNGVNYHFDMTGVTYTEE